MAYERQEFIDNKTVLTAKHLKNMEDEIVALGAKVYGNIQLPTNKQLVLYTVFNDLKNGSSYRQLGNGTRNYGLSVYLDHLFVDTKETDTRFDDNGSTYKDFSQSIGSNTVIHNGGVTKYETKHTCTVNDGDYSFEVVLRTIKNSATSSIKPIVMQIGDSVTNGTMASVPEVSGAPSTSWSWAKYYFDQDKKENSNSGFDALFVGYSSMASYTNYNGVSGKACAEGHGGWSDSTYTKDGSPFYVDANTPFSLDAFISRYRTMDDSGNRLYFTTSKRTTGTAGTQNIGYLEDGTVATDSNGNTLYIGSLITNTASRDVCLPNVIIYQLGFNGYNTTNELKILTSIKEEHPDMKLILSIIDIAHTNYPSLYPNWSGISGLSSSIHNTRNNQLNHFKWVVDTLSTKTYTSNGTQYTFTEENGVYAVYSGCVIPIPFGQGYRVLVDDLNSSFGNIETYHYVGLDKSEAKLHPSRFAHQKIGYLIYSMIKWIMYSD